MSKLIRADLPDDDWQALAELAARDGVKIGVYVKQLLVAHARDTSLVERVEAGIDLSPALGSVQEVWSDMTDWMLTEKHLTPKRVTEHFGFTKKTQVLAWARKNGYER